MVFTGDLAGSNPRLWAELRATGNYRQRTYQSTRIRFMRWGWVLVKRGSSVEIVWSPLARARLQEIHAFVALDKLDAGGRLATRIVAILEALRTHPRLGRIGSEPGVRELAVAGTPYVILYRVRGNRVTISTIWHGAQRWNR